jgi:MFS family permease
VGTWMQIMAQQVLIYRLTGSALALGIISVIGLVPTLPLSLWGGSISDRVDRRVVIICTQSTMLVQALLLAGLTWSGHIQVWHVYLLSLFLAGANAIDLPSRQAFTVDMVTDKEDLANAIGLNSAMFNGARALGPSLAGITIAVTGEGTAFFLNGVTFLAVIISLVLMRDLPRNPRSKIRVNTMEHMISGFRFASKQSLIAILISLVGVSAFLSMPYNTLLPVFAENILFDSAQPVVNAICNGPHHLLQCQSPEALPLGILMTAVGIGAVVGALYVASITGQRRGVLLTLGNMGFPIFLVVVSVSTSFLLTAVMLLLIGFSFVLQNALANTLIQLATPDEMRGRVMGLYTMTFSIMMQLGGLQAGVVADLLSARFSLCVGAVISLLFGIYVAIRHPTIRQM